VLSAIEDFLAAQAQPWRFLRIPAAFGLGVLVPEDLAERRPEIWALLAPWAAPQVEQFLARVELARIALLTGLGR
jgi:hypothetical protein